MQLSLDDAANEVGRNRSTIFRWIKSGKISAQFVDGRYLIDASDLHRFASATLRDNKDATNRDNAQQVQNQYSLVLEVESLRKQNELLVQMTNDLRTTSDDLRKRLDSSEEERKQLLLRYVPTETENPSEIAPETVTDSKITQIEDDAITEKKPGLWKRLFG